MDPVRVTIPVQGAVGHARAPRPDVPTGLGELPRLSEPCPDVRVHVGLVVQLEVVHEPPGGRLDH
jgi:hypothetical protein